MIEIGESAPDFTAPDDAGNAVALSELRGGPVLIHFFAAAWTST